MKVYPHHDRCPPALVARTFFGSTLIDGDGWEEFDASPHAALLTVMWAREFGAEFEPGDADAEGGDE